MGKWIKRFVLEKWFSHSEDLGMNIIGSTVRLIWHRSTAAHQVNKIFLFFLGRCIPCSTSDKHDTPFSACTTSPFLLISTHRHAPVYHLSLSGQRCDFFFLPYNEYIIYTQWWQRQTGCVSSGMEIFCNWVLLEEKSCFSGRLSCFMWQWKWEWVKGAYSLMLIFTRQKIFSYLTLNKQTLN